MMRSQLGYSNGLIVNAILLAGATQKMKGKGRLSRHTQGTGNLLLLLLVFARPAVKRPQVE